VVAAPVQIEEVDDVPQPRPVDQVADRPAEDEPQADRRRPPAGEVRDVGEDRPHRQHRRKDQERVDPAVIEVRKKAEGDPRVAHVHQAEEAVHEFPGFVQREGAYRPDLARLVGGAEQERRDDRHREFPQEGYRQGVIS